MPAWECHLHNLRCNAECTASSILGATNENQAPGLMPQSEASAYFPRQACNECVLRRDASQPLLKPFVELRIDCTLQAPSFEVHPHLSGSASEVVPVDTPVDRIPAHPRLPRYLGDAIPLAQQLADAIILIRHAYHVPSGPTFADVQQPVKAAGSKLFSAWKLKEDLHAVLAASSGSNAAALLTDWLQRRRIAG